MSNSDLTKTPVGKTLTLPFSTWDDILKEAKAKGYPSYSAYMREIVRQRSKLNLKLHQSQLTQYTCIVCGKHADKCKCKGGIKTGL
jgi:hypothetical protein